ncbi:MAG: DUF1499 domain-containing protein [Proteobacteria bacterium]|nr:DUF1499 domain-containing protein [Pseudomonadota bacterium]
MSESTPAQSSRVALVAFGIGALAFVDAGLGLAGIHLGLLTPMVGFLMYQLGNLGALLALVLSALGFWLTRGGDSVGRRHSTLGAVLGAAFLGITVLGATPGASAPPINDITTNLDDPPAFTEALQDPANQGRDMSYPATFVPIVREGYPDLQPAILPDTPAQAYERTLAGAVDLGWEVVREDPAALEFEAREISRLFKFVDDIVVRVRPSGAGSVVDVRSKSRDGRGDLGANAARIRALLETLER